MSQTKAQAYNTIKNASYSGEKRNWMFKIYITLHQKSHQILGEYGKPVPPAKQVRDLIGGINCFNGMMAAALATLLATNNLHADFQEASGYLCNFVAANKSENTTRNISGVGSRGQGGAGRGHSGGRGSDQGRGRGRGGWNYNKKKELSARSYTTEEWGQLIYEQKESLRKLRLIYKRQASAVSSITTQNNNETGNQSSVTHAGDQCAKANKKKKGGIDN